MQSSRRRKSNRGFTLVELLVTTFLIGLAVVGAMGGIRALKMADIKAKQVELVQRLAMQKLDEYESVTPVNTADSSGDFSDHGYPDVTYDMTMTPTSTANIDIVEVTAKQGTVSQSLTELFYIRPTTSASPTSGTP